MFVAYLFWSRTSQRILLSSTPFFWNSIWLPLMTMKFFQFFFSQLLLKVYTGTSFVGLDKVVFGHGNDWEHMIFVEVVFWALFARNYQNDFTWIKLCSFFGLCCWTLLFPFCGRGHCSLFALVRCNLGLSDMHGRIIGISLFVFQSHIFKVRIDYPPQQIS